MGIDRNRYETGLNWLIAPTRRLRERVGSRDEAGDTLVEVLAALVVIGLTVVAILGAFATTLSATVEQRNLANYNANLRGLVETANYQISLQPDPDYVACAVTGTYQSIADAYKAKIGGFSGSLKLSVVQYVPAAPANGCTNSPSVASPPQAPLQPQPQLIKATIGPAAPSAVVWDSIYFVVSDPHVTDTSSVSPSIATAGSTITINGTGFSGCTTCTVHWGSATIASGGGAGQFSVNSAGTQITFSAPTTAQAGTTNPSVSVTTPNGTSAFGSFTYLTLASISPTSGPTGTLVTLTGTGFTSAHSVIFGTGASAVTVSSGSFLSDTSTSITLDVPSGVSGTVPVSVTSVTNSVTYTSNTVTYTVTIALTFSPSTLPNGTVGNAYNQTVTASGGTAPYTYSVSSGSLPTGLNLNTSTGAITGTPTAAGSYTFTIGGTDSASPVHNTGSKSYTVSVTTALMITNVSSAGSHANVSFTGTGASGSTAITITVCAVNSFPCSGGNTVSSVATGSSPTNPWTTASTANNKLSVGTEYWAEATQGSATSAVFPFYVEAGQPEPIAVALANGGTSKKADAGDTITVTFSEPLNAATLCPAWGNTGTQTITDADIRFSAGSTESTLTVNSSASCGATLNFGTVGTGANYVSTSSGSDAADFSNSTVTWDPTNLTLVFKLGSLASGAANVQNNVTAGKPDYAAVAAMKDLGGNAASTTKFTAGTTSGF